MLPANVKQVVSMSSYLNLMLQLQVVELKEHHEYIT